MASRVKQALLKCIRHSVSSKDFLESFASSKPQMTLTGVCGDAIQGNLRFSIKNAEGNLDLKEIKLNGDKVIEAGASNQINITDISEGGEIVSFQISVEKFIRDTLTRSPTDLCHSPEKKKIVIEFSSPNIAKEFHVGHLRSTIIGNFISNLKMKLGNDVVKMNYLGDWGTQFGLLITGINLLELTDESLKTDTIQKLSEAYVLANRKAHSDEGITEKAREVFEKLENGDKEMLDLWTKIRNYSMSELNKWYHRLNISFDEFEWESNYNRKRAEPFLQTLEEKGLLSVDNYGRKVASFDDKEIPLLKSDGTTLYLLRDVIAYFDRRSRHNFDRIYYVVDTGQGGHFENLKRICEQIESNSSAPCQHVKFGRLTNLSTRKGTSVLLKDVLEEAEDRMYNKILSTKTTKGTPSRETAAILGTGAIAVNDLQRFRKTQYKFEWEQALNLTGKSAVQLQYTHCRLHSMKELSGKILPADCDPSVLLEPEAIQLAIDISRYEEALLLADHTLEAHFLVDYLFDLTKSINQAINVMHVKRSPSHLGSQRLLLFESARKVVADGLTLLGTKVLYKM